MTNHPIHLHGHEFEVTGTDGGPTRPESRWQEVTTDIAVGQMRQLEFTLLRKVTGPFIATRAITWGMLFLHSLVWTSRYSRPDCQNGSGPLGHGRTWYGGYDEMEMAIPENTVPMMTEKVHLAASKWEACSTWLRFAVTCPKQSTATQVGMLRDREQI